jgi:serine/threonine protein kinase
VPWPLDRPISPSNYRRLGLVGHGQFGRVYCAVHRRTGTLVALKELDKQRFPTAQFLRELRFLLSLEHPNIVTCKALEHSLTGRYLVMDYCEGGTLRTLLGEEIYLHPLRGLKLVSDILLGLAHAHDRGIVHCDIKPENILLTLHSQGWTARISDFGIARLSQEVRTSSAGSTGNTGSPAYMAPERFYGQYSFASDLYAVGILLYELLCGQRPFRGTPQELMNAHLNQAAQIPEAVPGPLQEILIQALQKLPARRFASAERMHQALQTATAQLSINWPHRTLLRGQIPQPPSPFASQSLVIQSPSPVQFSAPAKPEPIQQLWGQGGALGILQGRHLEWRSPPEFLRPPEFPKHEALGQEADPSNLTLPAVCDQLLLGPDRWLGWNHQALYGGEWPCKPLAEGFATELIRFSTPPLVVAQLTAAPFWCATVHPEATGGSLVDFWRWSHPREAKAHISSGNQAPSLGLTQSAGLSLPVQPAGGVALDPRHLLLISPLPQASQTRLDLLTRHGRALGSVTLDIALGPIALGPRPFELIATEPAYPHSVVLIQLKPLKLTRVGLPLKPWRWTTLPWGHVIGNSLGHLVLLDLQGQILGEIAPPPDGGELTALALLSPYGLALAMQKGSASTLHVLDLATLGLDIVF